MTTYTIAYTDSMLIACVADGEDISALIEGSGVESEDVTIESGLTLKDDDTAGECRYRGGDWSFPLLSATDGTQYRYAIR